MFKLLHQPSDMDFNSDWGFEAYHRFPSPSADCPLYQGNFCWGRILKESPCCYTSTLSPQATHIKNVNGTPRDDLGNSFSIMSFFLFIGEFFFAQVIPCWGTGRDAWQRRKILSQNINQFDSTCDLGRLRFSIRFWFQIGSQLGLQKWAEPLGIPRCIICLIDFGNDFWWQIAWITNTKNVTKRIAFAQNLE